MTNPSKSVLDMISKRMFGLTMAVILLTFPLLAQEPYCPNLEQRRARAFGAQVSPDTRNHTVQQRERIEDFREAVRAQGVDGILCLREMLYTHYRDPLFVFEGSMLLAELDQTSMSFAVILEVVSHTEIDLASLYNFLKLTMQLGQYGVNTAELGEKFLRFDGDTRIYLPTAHRGGSFFWLDHFSGAILIYGNMPNDIAINSLIDLVGDDDPYVHQTAIKLLGLNLMPDAMLFLYALLREEELDEEDRELLREVLFLRRKTAVRTVDSYSRSEVLKELSEMPHNDLTRMYFSKNRPMQLSAVNTLEQEDLPAVFEARRRVIAELTIEGLADYYALSRVIQRLYDKFIMFRFKYR